MVAGRGIVHSEMPFDDKTAHGLQLWINLPAKDKMSPPEYQELLAKDIPEVSTEGIHIKVIAGEALDVKAKVYTRTPIVYLDVNMEAGKRLNLAIPKSYNVFIYSLNGYALFGREKTKSEAHTTMVFDRDGEAEYIPIETTAESSCRFVVIGGEPIDEPVVQYGPFVMNTRQEIMQAFEDYQNAKNGFENARNWESEIAKRTGRR